MIELRWFQPKVQALPPILQYRYKYQVGTADSNVNVHAKDYEWQDVPTEHKGEDTLEDLPLQTKLYPDKE